MDTADVTGRTSAGQRGGAGPGGGVRYLRPGWVVRRMMNPVVRRAARWGIAPRGLRELRVRGRRSGVWRATPVNLLEVDGRRYLMAPRGTTEWVRNLRAAGGGELRVGRRLEAFTAAEVADADKAPLIRAYVERWRSEVKAFLDGIDETSTDEELLAVAPGFPLFEVLAA